MNVTFDCGAGLEQSPRAAYRSLDPPEHCDGPCTNDTRDFSDVAYNGLGAEDIALDVAIDSDSALGNNANTLPEDREILADDRHAAAYRVEGLRRRRTERLRCIRWQH
jgi:hypothetical protein